MSSVLISRAASTSGFAGTAAATSGASREKQPWHTSPSAIANTTFLMSPVLLGRSWPYSAALLPPARLRDMGFAARDDAEPLASSCEEGAKRPPRVVIFPNSKVLSSSRGVPAPAADPTSRNRGHDRSSARPESDLP